MARLIWVQGTYYGNGGGTGVCPASASEGNTLPTVAINAAQFGNSAACGACIKVHPLPVKCVNCE